MTKAELARRIANKTGVSFEDASKVLDALGETMIEGLAKEGWAGEPRVQIPGLGFFILKRDNRTVSGFRIEFKPGAVFKAKLEKVA